MKENSKNKVVENWIKIDIKLQKKLTKLKALNKEREILIKEAEKVANITPELKAKMEQSLNKFETLATEISELKKQAQENKF